MKKRKTKKISKPEIVIVDDRQTDDLLKVVRSRFIEDMLTDDSDINTKQEQE